MWRDDSSNDDRGIPRNRVRHEVLPALAAIAGANLPERLARQAEAWRDDEQWLTACVAVELPSVLMPHADGGWLIDLPRLHAVPPMLRRRVRLAVLEQMLPRGQVTLALVDGLERLESLRGERRARLGALTVWRLGTQLRLETGTEPRRPPPSLADQGLTVPGVVEVGETNLRIEASLLRRDVWEADTRPGRQGDLWAALDAERTGTTLVVRGRRPGDRVRPTGAPGSQKIQDLMVNRKVPRNDRGRVPVITTEQGRIAWVVGLAVGEEFAIQPHTTAVLLLQVTRSGG
jgi:tRNA(Ile)-lysidine synthase